jgi:hypothetical protein
MIATGETGRPDRCLALSTSPEILAVESVEAWTRQAEFMGCFDGGKFTAAMAGQEMADEGRWKSFDEL